MTAAEARRTGRFWLLTIISFALAAGPGGVVVHLVPLFRDLGSDPLAAAGTAPFVGLLRVVGRLGLGLLPDRFPAALLSLHVLTLAALGFAISILAGLDIGPTAH